MLDYHKTGAAHGQSFVQVELNGAKECPYETILSDSLRTKPSSFCLEIEELVTVGHSHCEPEYCVLAAIFVSSNEPTGTTSIFGENLFLFSFYSYLNSVIDNPQVSYICVCVCARARACVCIA